MNHKIQSLFRGIIKDYDKMNSIMSLGLHKHWRDLSIKMAEFPPCSIILDIGCGTGDFSLSLKKYVKAPRVFGIDLLGDMLIVAKQKADIIPIVGDTIFLPFKENSFDGLLLGFVLRHIPIQGFIKEAMRVLKPNGKIIILELAFPEQILIKFFFKAYLYRVIPLLGRVFSKPSPYIYLGKSLKYLPKTQELEALFYKGGAKKVIVQRLMLGSIFCLLAIK